MEKWDLLDENGNPTGATITRGEQLRPGQYHLVEHIWIVDTKGRILIQQRAPHLRLMPGVWAANSGSAISGEDSESAARRELFEELSIRTMPGELIYGGRMRRRNSFTDLWILYRDIDPSTLRLQKEEVARVRWVEPEELCDMIANRTFHHYGTAYFQFVFRAIERGRRTLYVTDLDGTLLQDDSTLSDYTVDTFNRLISRGMMLSVATARGTIGVQLVGLDRIHFRVPLVMLGGVLLYDLARRRIIHSCEMSADTVKAILSVFRKAERHPQLYRRRGNEVHIYYTSLLPQEEGFIHRATADGHTFQQYYHRVSHLKDSPAIFFSCQSPYDRQLSLKEQLDRIPGIRTVLYQDTYTEDNWFLEVYREDAGKDRGVERLQQRLHADRVVAFGDNVNDIPLFSVADLALCVQNASPAAMAAADRQIGANSEDGVARYLHAIYNRKL
ncbi:MAG: NUDIX domain-containing protein [Ruminococcaceae bacterium]|nr:NUDIX domain-containing protein [Oscillospiraceae bacterium]